MARTPEVIVKVTGRTRDRAHLMAHLTYITRNGDLSAEGRDGLPIEGRLEVLELAQDWSDAALMDSRRRANSPVSVSITLSMPAGTNAIGLRDAAREFAQAQFADRFDYVFALHTDAAHPHIHLTVRTLGDRGERLNPKKADLDAWRQDFARTLRDRGIAAEATPRRTRGVARKAERQSIRRLRERFQAGRGAPSRILRSAIREAGAVASAGAVALRPWEARAIVQQRRIRAFYRAQALLLLETGEPADRELGAAVLRFLSQMSPPESQRLMIARTLRAGGEPTRDAAERGGHERGR